MEVSAGRGTVRPVSGRVKNARRPPAARPRKRKSGGAQAHGFSGYLHATRSLGISLVLTLPLLVIYNVGLLSPANRMMNGVDLLTRVVGTNWGLYGVLATDLAIGVASLILCAIMIRTGRIRPWHWPVLIVEGVMWAAVLAACGYGLSTLLDRQLLPGAVVQPDPAYSLLQILTASAGAGYWEEIVFRVLLVGGPAWVASRLVDRGKGNVFVKGLLISSIMLVSAVAFSLVHYVGGHEQPETWSFLFRAMSGFLFGLLYLFRGFSVSASTHFVYDVIVFMIM